MRAQGKEALAEAWATPSSQRADQRRPSQHSSGSAGKWRPSSRPPGRDLQLPSACGGKLQVPSATLSQAGSVL